MKKNYSRDELKKMLRWGKKAELAIEYIPPFGALLMVIHDMFLCFGIRIPIAEVTFVFLAILLMLLCSYAYGYCTLHRAFIAYNWAMVICIYHERTFGFGFLLAPMHYIMLVVGIILLLCLLFKKNN